MKGKPLLSMVFPLGCLVIVALLVITPAPPALAAENGAGVYPPGYMSSMAGFLPPPGLYLRNDFLAYQGTSDRIPLSGRVELSLRARSLVNIVNFTYVTPNKILGANYAVGVMWGCVANSFIKGKVEFARFISGEREEDYTHVGDLTLVPIILGWHKGNFHIMALTNVYVPVGSYSTTRIVNTGLNRWALQPMVLATWLHPKIGTEVSMALGYTVNFKNYATDYTTGHELNLDFFAGQHLTKWLAVGLVGYFYQQVTGDSGAGAILGAFQGQALAIGPCITLNGKIGKHTIGLNLRYYDELTTTNRLNGQSFWGTINFGF